MIGDPHRCNAFDGNRLRKSILFGGLFLISAVRILAGAFVDYLRGKSILRAKLILDPEAVRIGNSQGLIALCQTGFPSAYVINLSAFLPPAPSQKVFQTGP